MKTKESIVFLSGLLCDETVWEDISKELQHDYEVLIISFRGCDSIEKMAKKVLNGLIDPVVAEDQLSQLNLETSRLDRTLSINDNVSEALARLVERGVVDPFDACDILNSGFNIQIVKKSFVRTDRP